MRWSWYALAAAALLSCTCTSDFNPTSSHTQKKYRVKPCGSCIHGLCVLCVQPNRNAKLRFPSPPQPQPCRTAARKAQTAKTQIPVDPRHCPPSRRFPFFAAQPSIYRVIDVWGDEWELLRGLDRMGGSVVDTNMYVFWVVSGIVLTYTYVYSMHARMYMSTTTHNT